MVHPSITIERINAAVEESMFGLGNPGFCTACGDDADGVEPDACEYKCQACGEMKVYGAEELMMVAS